MTTLVDGDVRLTSFFVNGSGLVDFTLIEGDDHQSTETQRDEEEVTEGGERAGDSDEFRLGRRTFRPLPTALVTVPAPLCADRVLVGGYAA